MEKRKRKILVKLYTSSFIWSLFYRIKFTTDLHLRFLLSKQQATSTHSMGTSTAIFRPELQRTCNMVGAMTLRLTSSQRILRSRLEATFQVILTILNGQNSLNDQFPKWWTVLDIFILNGLKQCSLFLFYQFQFQMYRKQTLILFISSI